METGEKKLGSGFILGGKVKVVDKDLAQSLAEKGYGEKSDETLALASWEALHLTAEGMLEVYDKKGRKYDMDDLLGIFSKKDKPVWSKYLVYRDLRERGYVVKPGFGLGVDFRVYERGLYGKEAAKFLVCSILEGEAVTVNNLIKILASAEGVKKQVILSVLERRGEVVYYTLDRFSL